MNVIEVYMIYIYMLQYCLDLVASQSSYLQWTTLDNKLEKYHALMDVCCIWPFLNRAQVVQHSTTNPQAAVLFLSTLPMKSLGQSEYLKGQGILQLSWKNGCESGC